MNKQMPTIHPPLTIHPGGITYTWLVLFHQLVKRFIVSVKHFVDYLANLRSHYHVYLFYPNCTCDGTDNNISALIDNLLYEFLNRVVTVVCTLFR